jgi:uncharacterized protein YbjT (DUF2867 family)
MVRRLVGHPAFPSLTVLTRRPLPPELGELRPRPRAIVADFDRLDQHPDAFRVSHVFCALGTTIKQAGSRERFRQVDYGYPLEVARLARAAGARHFLLVSSVGANAGSRVFYSRVKGELENAIIALGFPSVTIARPSMLLGDRTEFRLVEVLFKPISRAFPRKYRGVHARDVAACLVRAAVEDRGGVRMVENSELGG